MSTIIKPTIGRMVWYRPRVADTNMLVIGTRGLLSAQPLAAQICGVWSDTCVNLSILDASGNRHTRPSVLLVQAGAPMPDGGGYCEWMPYQVGQAQKDPGDGIEGLLKQLSAPAASVTSVIGKPLPAHQNTWPAGGIVCQSASHQFQDRK